MRIDKQLFFLILIMNCVGNSASLRAESLNTLFVFPKLEASLQIKPISDQTNVRYAISVTATGGSGTYRYSIDNGAPQASRVFYVSKWENHLIKIYDGNSLLSLYSGSKASPPDSELQTVATKKANAPLDLDIWLEHGLNCHGEAEGVIRAQASGGTGNYIYYVNTLPQAGNRFENIGAGDFSVRVFDGANYAEKLITLQYPRPELKLSLSPVDGRLQCRGTPDGAIEALAQGGSGNYEYAINGGAFQSSPVFDGLSPGQYTVRLRDEFCETEAQLSLPDYPNAQLILNATWDNTTLQCNDLADGVIHVSAQGGTGNYRFRIDGGDWQLGQQFIGLAPGNYSVEVDDGICRTLRKVNLPQFPFPKLDADINQTPGTLLCYGDQNGEITVVPRGGRGNYSYSLEGGPFQNSPQFRNLGPGKYDITVSDGACAKTISFELAYPYSQLQMIAKRADGTLLCHGLNDGRIDISPSGGSGNYQYRINGGPWQNDPYFDNLGPGNYTLGVTDGACTINEVFELQHPHPELQLSLTQEPGSLQCRGQADGTIHATAQGGSGNYSYSINGGPFQSSSSFYGLAPGTHQVTLRDGNCEVRQSIILNDYPFAALTLFASIESGGLYCHGLSDGVVVLHAAGGTGNYQYALGSRPLQASPRFDNVPQGTHEIRVFDGNCETRSFVTLDYNFPELRLNVRHESTTLLCHGDSDGRVILYPEGGSGVYRFRMDGGSWQNSPIFENLGQGTYTFIVEDGYCESSITFNLQPPYDPLDFTYNINPDALNCHGQPDGELSIVASGGSGNYSYQLDALTPQSSNIFTNLAPGTYHITIRDENCSFEQDVVVPDYKFPALTLDVQLLADRLQCAGTADGEIRAQAAGGSGDYYYEINGQGLQRSGAFDNLGPGTYTVRVSDGNCEVLETVTLNNFPYTALELKLTQEAGSLECFGSSDGVITATASGGRGNYEFAINNGPFQISSRFENLPAGSYEITVRDGRCEQTAQLDLTEQFDALTAQANFLDGLQCAGTPDGRLEVIAQGGSGNYEYAVNGSTWQASNIFIGLMPGNQNIQVRDPYCNTVISLVFSLPNYPHSELQLAANITPGALLCNGITDGEITAIASGGSGNYRYELSGYPEQASPVFSNLAPGTYTLWVRDETCESSISVVLDDYPFTPLTLDATPEEQVLECANQPLGIINAQAHGGSGNYQYRLDNGLWQNHGRFENLLAGRYTVTVNDGNCETSVVVDLDSERDELILTLNNGGLICHGDTHGRIIASVEGGTGNYQFRINGPGLPPGTWESVTGNTKVYPNLTPGTYTVEVSDGTCYDTETILLDYPFAPLKLSAAFDDSTLKCAPNNDGVIVANASGGSGNYSYSINGGPLQSPSGTFSDLAPGSYLVYVTDGFCDADTTIILPDFEKPALAMSIDSSTGLLCHGTHDGEISINASGGWSNYSYAIDNGPFGNVNTFDNLAPGSYTIRVSDGACEISQTVVLDYRLPQLEVTVQVENGGLFCHDSNDGRITLKATGGSLNYDYSIEGSNIWNDTGVFDNLSAGSYTFLIDDGNCVIRESVDLNPLFPELDFNTDIAFPNCAPHPDGRVEVLPVGGNGNYRFAIDGGSFTNNPVMDSLAPGVHRITLADDHCFVEKEITLTPHPFDALELNLRAEMGKLSCTGFSDGVIIAEALGGRGTYEYSLDGISWQASPRFEGLSAGDYEIWVSDGNCQNSAHYLLEYENEALVLNAEITPDRLLCYGDKDGEITLKASGGTGNYQFKLEDGPWLTDSVFSGLGAGTYSFTLSDGICENQMVLTLAHQNPRLVLNVQVMKGTLQCNGISDGMLVAEAFGGSGQYQYRINNGAWSNKYVFENLGPDTYVVEVFDGTCTTAQNIELPDYPFEPLEASVEIAEGKLLCAGIADGEVEIKAEGGSGNYVYAIDAQPYRSSPLIENLLPGQHVAYVRDGNFCVTEVRFTLADYPHPPLELQVQQVEGTLRCHGVKDGVIAAMASGGSGKYMYSINHGDYKKHEEFRNLGPGDYTISVSDGNCSVERQIHIGYPFAELTLDYDTDPDALQCHGDANGLIRAIAAGGSGDYQYRLSGSEWQSDALFEGLLPGEYLLEVNDGNCRKQATINLPFYPFPKLSAEAHFVDGLQCHGIADGRIRLETEGGRGDYMYSIDSVNYQATPMFENLGPGSHSILVSDGVCTTSTVINLPDYPFEELLADLTFEEGTLLCHGIEDGVIVVEASGGREGDLEYAINGGDFQRVNRFEHLAPGTYTVSISDGKCSIQRVISLYYRNPELNFSVSHREGTLECPGDEDGIVDLSITGGDPLAQYELSLNNGPWQAATPQLVELAPGSYNLKVTDGNCIVEKDFELQYQNTPMNVWITYDPNNLKCHGIQDGAFEIHAEGGNGVYTYSLVQLYDNDSTDVAFPTFDPNFTGIAPGNYIVRVFDGSCQVDLPVRLQYKYAKLDGQASFVEGGLQCAGEANGVIEVAAQGGAGDYRYALNGGEFQDEPVFTDLVPGEYIVTIQDAEGCETHLPPIITPNPAPLTISAQLDAESLLCYGIDNGKITLSATGGTPPYRYAIDDGKWQDTPVFEDLEPGSYHFSVIDAHGCSTSSDQAIHTPKPTELQARLALEQDITCAYASDGILSIQELDGGAPPYRFELHNAKNDELVAESTQTRFEQLPAGDYYLVMFDAQGCSKTFPDDLVVISEPEDGPLKLKEENFTDTSCHDYFENNIWEVSSEGGEGQHLYRWSLNGNVLTDWSTRNSLEQMTPGEYMVEVRDERNCIQLLTRTVTNPEALQALLVHDENTWECYNSTDGQLRAQAQGGVPPYQYALNGGDYQDDPVFGQLTLQNYTLSVMDSKGCVAEFQMSVDPNLAPAPILVEEILVQQPVSCHNGNDGVIKVNASQGDADVYYVLGYKKAITSFDGYFRDLSPGEHHITIISSTGCQEEVSINLPNPSEITGEVSIDYDCFNEINIEVFNVKGGSGSYTYDFGNGPQSAPTLRNATPGQTYTLTVDDGFCALSYEIPVMARPEPLHISAEQTRHKSIEVKAVGGVAPYEYSLDGYDYQSSNKLRVENEGLYTIFVQDAVGCVEQIELRIVHHDILIPNFFTPNNDSYNDTWEIRVLDDELNDAERIARFKQLFPDAVIRVFDRGGRLMRRYSGADEGWNGTFDGLPVHANSYWYTIELDAVRQYSGHVTIKR